MSPKLRTTKKMEVNYSFIICQGVNKTKKVKNSALRGEVFTQSR